MTELNISIGGTAIEVTSGDSAFLETLRGQYADFIDPCADPRVRLRVDADAKFESDDPDEDVRVENQSGVWTIRRGDFEARYDSSARCGVVRQAPNRHSIDSVLRIVHTLMLADESGFLLHSASAIRNGRAFLFPGRSGAGKTTISRLAPADAYLLSDEVSYVRQSSEGFRAWGTPFTGDLGTPGVNRSARIDSLYFLAQAAANGMSRIGEGETVRLLMNNILFFAEDSALVSQVFESACRLAAEVPAFRFEFTPDRRAWELVQ